MPIKSGHGMMVWGYSSLFTVQQQKVVNSDSWWLMLKREPRSPRFPRHKSRHKSSVRFEIPSRAFKSYPTFVPKLTLIDQKR